MIFFPNFQVHNIKPHFSFANLLENPELPQTRELLAGTPHLWVIHVPHQAVLSCVQDEVAPQEFPTILIFLNV